MEAPRPRYQSEMVADFRARIADKSMTKLEAAEAIVAEANGGLTLVSAQDLLSSYVPEPPPRKVNVTPIFAHPMKVELSTFVVEDPELCQMIADALASVAAMYRRGVPLSVELSVEHLSDETPVYAVLKAPQGHPVWAKATEQLRMIKTEDTYVLNALASLALANAAAIAPTRSWGA